MLTQNEMIEALIKDFLTMFPDAKQFEVVELKQRLIGLDLNDLELLVSQIKTEGV